MQQVAGLAPSAGRFFFFWLITFLMHQFAVSTCAHAVVTVDRVGLQYIHKAALLSSDGLASCLQVALFRLVRV